MCRRSDLYNPKSVLAARLSLLAFVLYERKRLNEIIFCSEMQGKHLKTKKRRKYTTTDRVARQVISIMDFVL